MSEEGAYPPQSEGKAGRRADPTEDQRPLGLGFAAFAQAASAPLQQPGRSSQPAGALT